MLKYISILIIGTVLGQDEPKSMVVPNFDIKVKGTDLFISVFKEGHQCISDMLKKYELNEDAGDLWEYLKSPEWRKIVNQGDADVFNQNFGNKVEPILKKLYSPEINGPKYMENIPWEMREWIKDSSRLWIENKGAGNTTSEYMIHKENEHKAMLVLEQQKNREIDDLKKYY